MSSFSTLFMLMLALNAYSLMLQVAVIAVEQRENVEPCCAVDDACVLELIGDAGAGASRSIMTTLSSVRGQGFALPS